MGGVTQTGRQSLTGWLVFLRDSSVSWKMKKQHIVSQSSAEAEYRSITMTTCELKWLKALLSSLGVFYTRPVFLPCDSQAAYIFLKILFFMNELSILRSIVTLFAMKLSPQISIPLLSRPMRNLLTFSQRRWTNDTMSIYFASWAYGIFMHQL